MEILFRHFWIAFVVTTVINGRHWWRRVQDRIRAQPELEPGYRRLYRGYMLWWNLPWLVMGFGVLTGRVSSMFDYLQPSAGNPFVLLWWGLMAALLALGTWWIFAGSGAELLERHPGVYMVPAWPASKLRLFWLGLVAWNVVIGTLLFLGFFGAPSPPSGAPHPPPDWAATFFPVFFVGMWVLVSYSISAIGGWHTLAGHYAESSPCTGARFRLRSGQIGGLANYGGVLMLGADRAGLHLSVALPFRLAHPPLCVPWSDIRARAVRRWLSEGVELEFAKAPNATLRISRSLASSLFDAAGTPVQVQPAA
ncbi:MAG TPA: hypothetical protein VMS55_06310 [Myxococcota bacterium]|nr:hypothetical protein [Myxococcota bacterium]